MSKAKQNVRLSKYKHFSSDERLELAILRKKGYSVRDIADALGRSPSSVSRELQKNSVKGAYDPIKAKQKARVRRWYSKYQGMKIQEDRKLQAFVREKLQKSWSPDAIAGRWRRDTGDTLSPETIYKYLYSTYGQSFCRYLRYKQYRKKKQRHLKDLRYGIKNRVFVDKRPLIINQRKRYGDFEGDTLGKSKGERETLVGIIERKSRYILAKKVSTLADTVKGFKELLVSVAVKSLTLDNGFENAHYEELGISTYFCHPYSSWEKGQIENAFGLLREYIPKKKSLTHYTNKDIQTIINTINQRPRKCLKYRTPKEVFEENILQANTS